jgi:hypothetical protein
MRYGRAYLTELPVLRDLLPEMQTPVQIIAGARGPFVPLVNAEFLHERPPHSKLEFIDAGHFSREDAPDEYAALVTSWWAEATPPPNLGQHADRDRKGIAATPSCKRGEWNPSGQRSTPASVA